MGFQFQRDTQRALRRTRQALNARRDEEKPDHAIRLKAADRIFALAGLDAKDTTPLAATSVTLVWNTTAQEIPPAGLRTALSSTSSVGFNGSPSSCAIEDGERPPSA